MSAQILNERSFSGEAVASVTGGKAVTSTMTYGGVIVRALFFLILTVVFASAGWRAAADKQPQSGMWFFLGYILLIAISVAAASNPRLAAVAGILYAVLMGFWMGSISRLYETYYDGIVAQAIIASVATFLATLLLYATRVIRVTGKFIRVLIVGMVGLLFTYLVGWILSIFGVHLLFLSQPNNVGIAISVAICVLAAMSLAADFAFVEVGVSGGAPAVMAWYAAYGLLTTLVWLYLEILRLLALLRAGQ